MRILKIAFVSYSAVEKNAHCSRTVTFARLWPHESILFNFKIRLEAMLANLTDSGLLAHLRLFLLFLVKALNCTATIKSIIYSAQNK